MAKGVKSIKGNASPKVGETNYYEVSSFYPGTHIESENDIKWKLFVQERNGSWRELKGPKKTGKKVPYLLPEKWLGRKMLIEAYVYNIEKKASSAITMTPVRNNIPTIDKVDLLYVDDTKGSTFSFREKLRTRAYCTNMFNKELVFTLWEDDAKRGGHNPKNKPIETLPPKNVDKNGVAVGEFVLTKALMQKAMQGEADPKQLEFYVTVEHYVNKKHATDNIEINNPFPQTQKPQTSPSSTKTPSKPATIPKAKGSPAESKPASKKEEKGIGEIIAEKGKELWDWWESKGTIKKEQKPTQQPTDKKSAAKKESIELPKTNTVCECEQYNLIWGNKVSCKFRKKVIAIAKELWPNDFKNMANNLMAVFAWETGETFKPDVPNRAGSGATGLIQFMPDKVDTYFGHKATMETVPNYFNSKDAKLHNLPRIKEFAQMKAEDQLDYVKKYFEDQKGKKLDFVDFYLQVLFPVSSGKPEHIVFGTEKYRDQIGLSTDSDSVKQKRIDKYAKNSGMDINKDGKLYKSEIALSVQPFITKGLPEIFRKRKKKEENNTDKKTISDAIIVTDAGHGINGDGGNSKKGNPDSESKMTLMIETETANALKAKNIKNKRTRTAETLSVSENQITYRVNFAKKNKAKVFVSHHLDYVPLNKDNSINEQGAKSTNRIVVNIHPQNLVNEKGQALLGGASDDFYKNSISLANLIVDELKKVFTDRDVLVKQAKRPNISHDWLGVLKNMDGSDRAAVLIELGNTTEANTSFLTTNKVSIGKAIATGVEKYLGNDESSSSENISDECENESPIIPITENESPKEEGCKSCHQKHYDLTSKVKWQTQFDPKWGNKKKQKVACKKTCDDILVKAGLKATSSANLFQASLENKTHTSIIINKETSKQGIAYMDSELEKGHPVQLGIDHILGYGFNEGTTDHFVVAVGKGCVNGKIYYRFYDVGTSYKEKGASENNRLFLDTSDYSLKGATVYNGSSYTVTQIRKNL